MLVEPCRVREREWVRSTITAQPANRELVLVVCSVGCANHGVHSGRASAKACHCGASDLHTAHEVAGRGLARCSAINDAHERGDWLLACSGAVLRKLLRLRRHLCRGKSWCIGSHWRCDEVWVQVLHVTALLNDLQLVLSSSRLTLRGSSLILTLKLRSLCLLIWVEADVVINVATSIGCVLNRGQLLRTLIKEWIDGHVGRRPGL